MAFLLRWLDALVVWALSGACGTILLGVALGIMRGHVSKSVAWVALAVGGLLGIPAGYAVKRVWKKWYLGSDVVRGSLGVTGWLVVAVYGMFALRAFLWHVAEIGGEILVVGSAYNHGDLVLHMGLVKHIAAGAAFWPESLLLGSHKMAYPLGVDLLHALLTVAGMPLMAGFAWIGLVSSGLTLRMLWRWGGVFAIATFLFVGGGQAYEIFLGGGIRDYMADSDWKSIPLAMFTTQRGLLLAIPSVLALMASWRARSAQSVCAGRLPFWVELLLYATLPLVHMHSFLFASILLGAAFLMTERKVARHFLLLVFAALVPASISVWLVVDVQGSQMRSIAWAPGWMQGESNPFFYWPMNFGLWSPLLIGSLVVAFARHVRRASVDAGWDCAVAGSACLVFLMCCLFRFAPWPWDNTKLMLWSFLAIAPVAWRLLLARLGLAPRTFALVLLTFSGAVSLLGGLRPPSPPNQIAQSKELDCVAGMLGKVEKNARIACAPEWNHPVILSGYKLAVGYDGHLWSHGYDYLPSMNALNQLMRGDADWRKHVAVLVADYLFWGPREQAKFGLGPKPWMSDAVVVANEEGVGILYKLPKIETQSKNAPDWNTEVR